MHRNQDQVLAWVVDPPITLVAYQVQLETRRLVKPRRLRLKIKHKLLPQAYSGILVRHRIIRLHHHSLPRQLALNLRRKKQKLQSLLPPSLVVYLVYLRSIPKKLTRRLLQIYLEVPLLSALQRRMKPNLNPSHHLSEALEQLLLVTYLVLKPAKRKRKKLNQPASVNLLLLWQLMIRSLQVLISAVLPRFSSQQQVPYLLKIRVNLVYFSQKPKLLLLELKENQNLIFNQILAHFQHPQ